MKKPIRFPTLHEWRAAHGLTQRQAAARFGITQGCWQKTETGLTTPRRALLARLARTTGVPVEGLTGIDR